MEWKFKENKKTYTVDTYVHGVNTYTVNAFVSVDLPIFI